MAASGGVSMTPSYEITLGTPANAQTSACLPGVYSPSHVVQPGDCYTPAEFNKAMKAEGQQPIFVGNRDAGAYKYGDYWTSNADGSKGVNAEMDVAFENKSSATEIRIPTVYTDIRVNDVNASSSLPGWARLNIDEAKAKQFCASFNGACSTYNSYLKRNTVENGGVDTRIMLMAQSIVSPKHDGNFVLGKKVVIFRNMNTGYGDIADISAVGSITPSFGMKPVSPTQFLAGMIQAQTTMPNDLTFAAPPKVATVAPPKPVPPPPPAWCTQRVDVGDELWTGQQLDRMIAYFDTPAGAKKFAQEFANDQKTTLARGYAALANLQRHYRILRKAASGVDGPQCLGR